jgi:hypothetical protein
MQPQRRFRIVIESYVPLVQAEKGVQDEIAINYKGIQVKNLASLQIEVSNRGNVPIKPEDYFRPIELSVDGMILEVRQIQSSDLDIQLAPLISSPQEAIHLNPALLNQSDSVTLLLTISEDNGTRAVDTLEVQGRLIDGSINFLRSKPTTADDVIQVSEGISADKKQPGALTASLFALADQMAQVENWSVVRDLVIILVLMTIAMAILLDAVIPF